MARSFAIRSALLCAALATCAAGALGQPLLHHNRDDEELRQLRSQYPEAAALFERADGLVRHGKLAEAEPLLAEAAVAVPLSFMVARRQCQVLAELGQRSRAVDACNRALKSGHMAMDRLATVSALMTGPDAPNGSAVAQAVNLAMAAKNLTGQPFGDAALCEIGYRLGDAQMLRDCTTELGRIAPQHYLTRRFQAVVEQNGTGRFWFVWGLFGFAALGTTAHALRRRRGARRAVSSAAVTAALLGACVLVAPGAAQAEPAAAPPAVAVPAPSGAPPEAAPHHQQKKDGHWQLSRFPIDQANPESKIPTETERNNEPLDFGYFLQDLASEGAYAEKKGDYASAVKYWRALAKAVPDVATGFRRACRAYEALKDRRNGLDYCGSTLNLQGAELEDYVHYGNLMLMKTTPLDAAELSDFENTIKHLRGQGGDGPLFIAETLSCELGVAQEDVKRLESCTQTIEKLKPNEPQTLSFQWSLAMFRHDYAGAQELVSRLKTTSYKPELVARMAAATQTEARWWKPFLSDWRYQLGALVALLLGGFALFSRRKAAALPPTPQTPAPGVS